MTTPNSDRGSISAFVVMLVLTFAVCAGLAVDGGRIVGGHVRAADHAENAARVGAQEIVAIRTGTWRLDRARARTAARRYLDGQGVGGQITVSDTRVTVTVDLSVSPSLLRLAGVGSTTVRATRSSDPVSP